MGRKNLYLVGRKNGEQAMGLSGTTDPSVIVAFSNLDTAERIAKKSFAFGEDIIVYKLVKVNSPSSDKE